MRWSLILSSVCIFVFHSWEILSLSPSLSFVMPLLCISLSSPLPISLSHPPLSLSLSLSLSLLVRVHLSASTYTPRLFSLSYTLQSNPFFIFCKKRITFFPFSCCPPLIRLIPVYVNKALRRLFKLWMAFIIILFNLLRYISFYHLSSTRTF